MGPGLGTPRNHNLNDDISAIEDLWGINAPEMKNSIAPDVDTDTQLAFSATRVKDN